MTAYWHLIFDGILVLSAAGIIILCTIKGFVGSVLSFGKTVISLILAYIFGGRVASWLAQGFLGEWVRNSVFSMFRNMFDAGAETFDLSRAVEEMPDSIRALLVNLGVDMNAISASGTENAATAEQLREFSLSVSNPIVDFVSSVLGFLLVFFVSIIAISVLIRVSDLITSIPGIHFCNQTLGFLLAWRSLLSWCCSLPESARHCLRWQLRRTPTPSSPVFMKKHILCNISTDFSAADPDRRSLLFRYF